MAEENTNENQYVVLARKYRPQNFEDLLGQDALVQTLTNAIQNNRLHHAYILTGIRGVGKTTTARLIARALNCTGADGKGGPTIHPCGVCDNCKAIAAGRHMDVMELDAASHTGVDDIRELLDSARYAPTNARYKVYIIDEVHMLSTGAFNALLKTLEEPPEYVIFILATTEVHKIPITILSRCQHYDFKRISIETITARMQELMDTEQIEVEDKALRYIAKAADGSMRDALSLLDQCIAFYLGEKLTYDNVLEVLGTVDIQVYSDLLDMILSQDINGVMDLLEDVARQGREWSQFITDFLWYLRNLLLVGQGNAAEEALEVSTDQLKLLQEKAQQVEENTLIRYIRILSELLERIRYATSKRVLVEVEMMKMCRPQIEADTNSLADRVRQLEQQLEQLLQSGIPVQQAAQAGQNQIALQQEVKSEQDPVEQLNEKFPPAKVEELIELVNHWRDVKRNLSPQMKYCLQRATLSVNEEGTALRVLFPKEMNVESGYFLEEPERIEQLKQELSRQSGRDVELEVSVMNTDNDDSDMINLDCIHMDVKIED